MKPLTLKNLDRAISHFHKTGRRSIWTELMKVRYYLTGKHTDEPTDPREVLTSVGYKW